MTKKKKFEKQMDAETAEDVQHKTSQQPVLHTCLGGA